MATQLTIPLSEAEGSFSTCKPNLMPFHIQYTGPASVRTFMMVEKLKSSGDEGKNPKPEKSLNSGSPIGAAEMKRESSKMDVEADTPPASADISGATSPEGDVDMAPVTLTRTNTEPIIVDSQPEIVPSTSTLTSIPSSSTLAVSTATSQTSISVGPSVSTSSLVQPPPIEDLDKRVVSSFRGRTIHGLEVDVPAGFVGVVFKAEGSDSTSSHTTGTEAAAEKVEKKRGRTRQDTNTSSAKVASSTSSAKKDNADDEDEEPTRPTRRRGRFTSSAVPMKGTVITIEDDKPEIIDTPMVDLTNEDDAPPAEDSATTDDDVPIRKLIPQAQFTSFTLWQADRIVDKTNDEYMKALTEWVGLASEIHRTDLDFE